MGRQPPHPLTFLLIGVIILAGLAGRALKQRHVTDKGTSAQASVLRVDTHRDLRTHADVFHVVQLVIPRPDGIEIVGTVTVIKDPPQPGWTVPVSYLERLGTTTKVVTTGPFRPAAEPPAPGEAEAP